MAKDKDLHFFMDRALFFEIGRALTRNWSGSYLGPVSLEVRDGKLGITSKRGGGAIPCEGTGEIFAELGPAQFRRLIGSRSREKSPSGKMKLTFRPAVGEVAIDVAGVKARFI